MAATLIASSGCSRSPLHAQAPAAKTEQARCSLAGGAANPLVTEWPASEKAHLELLLREGGVAVAYSGCELKVIEGCRVTGRYAWHRTTPSTDEFEMRSVDDLYARLPVGAISLEGTLAQAGRLTMRTTVAGQFRLVDAGSLSGANCASATHVVTGMSVGAFQLSSGEQIAASAGVATPVAGAGLGTEREESLVRRAGDMSRCTAATDAGADPQCQSPIQLFLAPIPPQAAAHVAIAPHPPYPPVVPYPAAPVAAAPPAPAPAMPLPPAPTSSPPGPASSPPAPAPEPPPPPDPAPASEPPPPPEAPAPAVPQPEPAPLPPPAAPWLPPAPKGRLDAVPAPDAAAAKEDDVPSLDISLTSSDPDATFVLAAGGKPLCTSPCKHRVRVDDLVTVTELRDGKVQEIALDNLRNYAPAGGIDVTATPRSGSAFTGGVVLAGLGGVGLLAGLVTLFIGARERNDVTREVEPNTGAMVAGGVVLAAGAAAIPFGVVLIVGHGESVEIKPAQGVTLSLGPGILFGAF